MPELPEVETTVRGLRPVLEGQLLARVEPRRADLRRPIPPDLRQRMTGARVTGLGRRAKYGFRSSAASAGDNVSELKAEITVEMAIVMANCLKNWPLRPVMNAMGTNTATSVSEIGSAHVCTPTTNGPHVCPR